jgi:hypothetical protein
MEKVGSADMGYKIPRENGFWMTTHPVHKLIMVVPVGEQHKGEQEG